MFEAAGAEVFDTQLDSWRAWQRSPWGRIRYRVVAQTLHRTCAVLGSVPLRVLDVGGGNGGDAVPLAEAGHEVTVLDYSAPLLEEARLVAEQQGVANRFTAVHGDITNASAFGLGSFDLVLCHNVVQYQADPRDVVRSLTELVNPRGALSMIATNPPSDVLTAIIRRADLQEAARMLTSLSARASTFGHDVRRVPAAEVESALVECGFSVLHQYGIRVITDYIADNARKEDPEFYQQLEQLELALCDQEPYLRTARLWQLVAQRSLISWVGGR